MLNVVTGPPERPSAVLIRGVEGINGPGRVTKRLGIDRKLNTLPATPDAGLWLEDDGFAVPRAAMKITPRIGVDYAGPVWAMKPWRFYFTPVVDLKLEGNERVSESRGSRVDRKRAAGAKEKAVAIART